jgi:hypothetical protein
MRLVGAAGSVETAGLQEKTMKFVTKFASTVLPIAAVAAAALAVGAATPAAAAVHHASHSLYDVAPQGRSAVNSDDPSLTGGGSAGYNQNIYNW